MTDATDAGLGEVAVSLLDLAVPVLADGFRRLRDQLSASTGLRAVALAEGVEAVLTGDHPELVRLRKARRELATRAESDAERAMAEAIQARFPGDGVIGEENRYDAAAGATRTWFLDPVDGTSEALQQLLAHALGAPLAATGGFGVTVGAVSGGGAVVGGVRELRLVKGELVPGDLWVAAAGQPLAAGAGLRGSTRLADAVVACTVPEVMFPAGPAGEASLPSLQLQAVAARVRRVATGLNAVGAMRVVTGGVDAFLETDLTATDIVGLLCQLEAAGVRATDLEGAPLQLDRRSLLEGPSRGGVRDGTYQVLAARDPLHGELLAVLHDVRAAHPQLSAAIGTAAAHGYVTKAAGPGSPREVN